MKRWEELNSFIQWVCIICSFLVAIIIFAGFFYLVVNDPGEYILGVRDFAQDWFYQKNSEAAAAIEALGSFEILPYISILLVGGIIFLLLLSSYLEFRKDKEKFGWLKRGK